MIQPFDNNDVLFRFVPSEEEQERYEAEEYIVRGNLDGPQIGLRMKSGEWWWSTASIYFRPVIARLLYERDALTAELTKIKTERDESNRKLRKFNDQSLFNLWEDRDNLKTERGEFMAKETALKHAIADLTATLAKVDAERDIYRAALEAYELVEQHQSDDPHLAHAALEQGAAEGRENESRMGR